MANNTRCAAALSTLRIGTSGDYGLCCLMSTNALTGNDFQRFKMQQMSIADFWKSPERLSLLAALDAGIQHHACRVCWDIENSGGKSLRMRENKRLEEVKLDWYTMPNTIDLNLSNTCNIKCRTCSVIASSAWTAEEKALPNQSNKDLSCLMRILKERVRPLNDDLIKIREFMTDVTTINAYGGEPMLVKELWDLLAMFTDEELKNMTLHMNTNGTVYDERKLSILKKFKFIDLNVSIDGIGPQFEYLRHPAKWSEVEENLNKFLVVSAQNEWKIIVCVTISALNVYYLPEIMGYFESRDIPYYLNMIHDPSHLTFAMMAESGRKKINARLVKVLEDNLTTNPFIVDQIKSIMSLLRTIEFSERDLAKFIENTTAHDNYRNESYEVTFPEFAELIKVAHNDI